MLGLAMSLNLLACNWGEPSFSGRVFEMRDHEIDAFDALVAFRERDLSALHAAGAQLARADDVPNLPDAAQGMLAAVRGEGAVLSKVQTVAEGAAPMGRMAARCGACHELMQVEPAGAVRTLPLEEAFFAVAFHEEARWERAATGLADIGGLNAKSWGERAEVLTVGLHGWATR